jgi:Rrf2 family protein
VTALHRGFWHTRQMRISAKVDYAIRAMAEMAVADAPVTAQQIAEAQDLPLRYLLGILGDLRRTRLVQSQRGPEGGFALGRPADQISLADVFRAIDGPLAEVHDLSLTTLEYRGPAAELRTVWLAVRASLRRVLETVTLADVAAGLLPDHVLTLADEYETAVADRPPSGR